MLYKDRGSEGGGRAERGVSGGGTGRECSGMDSV